MNNNLGLSYNARKALSVHIGEAAASEIATLFQQYGFPNRGTQAKQSKCDASRPDAKARGLCDSR